MKLQSTETQPGIKNGLDLTKLFPAEKTIVNYLAEKYWYVTRIDALSISGSQFRVVLIKPVDYITQSFNLLREVIVVFSSYESFEPRTLDAIEKLNIPNIRTEEICSIVISRDQSVSEKVDTFLKSNRESRVIVPFTYAELSSAENQSFFLNRLREEFYSRDLFDIQNPLKRDLFFFGRKELVSSLVNKHLTGENIGLFGLRKTGKTSILFSVMRSLDRKQNISVFLDCMTLHMKRWNVALHSIIEAAREESGIGKSKIHSLEEYTTDKAADLFLTDIKSVYTENKRRSVLLIFDEIENITFGTSASSNWRDGTDFLLFWQAIRSAYQKLMDKKVFSFLIAGTNPRCVEEPTIKKTDNPIFSLFSPQYLEPFEFGQTKEMVDRLGGYMGLSFMPEVIAQLVNDFGGHPLLIRQMCSFIHKNVDPSRPVIIDKYLYQEKKEAFYSNDSGFIRYARMILEVLETWYPEEYSLLIYLAVGNIDEFDEYAREVPEYVAHLLHYGIIAKGRDNKYHFRIEALQRVLSNDNKYQRLHLSDEDKQKEISERRNAIEPKLRVIVRRQLKAFLGEVKAKDIVVKAIYKNEAKKHDNSAYADYFDPNKHKIFLKTLFDLIESNFECFKNIFDTDLDIFKAKANLLNHYRKPDAHAAPISDADFNTFRGAMQWLEEKIEEF